MKELLSNDEIDTLLELFRTEGPPPDLAQDGAGFDARPKGEGPVVSEVDLLKPNRFSRDDVRNLERIFEGAAKGLTATMSDKLRLEMHCDCVAVEQMRYQSWLRIIGGPCAVYLLKMPPFEQPVPLTVTTQLLYGAVDRILGGSGRPAYAHNEFTEAEYTVADAFIKPCLERICAAMEDLGPFTFEIVDRFSNPSMAQVVAGQDVVLGVQFQVSSELIHGDLHLAIPHESLAPCLQRAEIAGSGTSGKLRPGALREVTAQSVRPVALDLSVVLGATEVPLRQLLGLQVGDVVPLPTRVGEPLVAPIQGEPKFLGQVGTQGSRLAFQVGSVIET